MILSGLSRAQPTTDSTRFTRTPTAWKTLLSKVLCFSVPRITPLGTSSKAARSSLDHWTTTAMNHKSSEAFLTVLEFNYNLSRAAIVSWLLFFATSMTFFGYQCVTNDRGLVLNGIPFDPFGATVFYGFVAATSMFCLGAGTWLLFRRGRIAFGSEVLLIPKSWWSTAEKVVPYRDLRGVRLGIRCSAISGARLLYIHHTCGFECLSAAMFSSDAAFDEFQQLLIRKLNESEVE